MPRKDGAQAWLVLIGVVFCTFFQTGIVNSLGDLLPTLQQQFENNGHHLLIGRTVSSTLLGGSILGILLQDLYRRQGARVVVIVAGLVSSSGLIAGAVSQHFPVLIIGILCTSIVLVAETVLIGILPRYFDKYYNVAVSVSIFGTALGVMFLPPITEVLQQCYGWRGAMLILGGINVHLIASGALLYPQKSPNTSKPETEYTPLVQKDQQNNVCSKNEPVPDDQEMLDILEDFLELNLLKSYSFIVVLIISGVYGYTFGGWGIYIITLLQSKDLYSFEAVAIATAGGIGKLATMIALPMLNSKFSVRFLMYISSILLFISMLGHAFTENYYLLMIQSVIFGVGQGILSVEVYILGYHVVGEDKGVQAVTWMHLFYGIFGTIGGYVTGVMYEMTKSAIIPFLAIAGVSLLEAISLLSETCHQKIKASKT